MPSNIQKSAMGMGARYPLFENDFMQNDVVKYFLYRPFPNIIAEKPSAKFINVIADQQ